MFWVLLGGYFLTVIFSIFKSLNPGDAIFDSIHVIAPFLLLPAMLIALEKDKTSIIWILRLQNIAVLVFMFYGGLQLYHAWQASESSHEPLLIDYTIASTLGNKNFFSETILMLLPFSLAGIWLLQSTWKWLSVLTSAIIILGILFLKTASVQAGMAAGLIFVLVVAMIFNNRSKNFFSTLKGWVLTTVVLGIVVYSLTRSQVYKDAIQKIRQTTSTFTKDASEEILVSDEVNRNSTFTRWFLWRNTFYLIRESPVTGIGMGNWKAYYAKYGVNGAYYLNTGANRFEHPHNEYLLMFCERGIVSFILWVAILVLLIFYAADNYRKLSKSSERFLMLCMSGGIVFFAVISLFGYPIYRSYSPLMLVLIAAVILHYRLSIVSNESKARSYLLFSPIALAGIFIMFVLVKRYQGEVNMTKAFNEQSRMHFDRMNKLVTEAESYYFPLDLTTTPLTWYKGFSFFHNQQTDSALVYFHKAELQSPYHIQVLNDLGACYENKGDHARAMQYFDKVLKITPLYEETMLNKIVTLYNTGNVEAAYRLLHSRTYEWTSLFLSCRRAIFGSVITELLGSDRNDSLVEVNSKKLSSDLWISGIESRTNGSFSHLKSVLAKEFQK